MQTQPSSPPKPVTDWWRPELVFLPPLTLPRRLFRILARGLAKLLTFLFLKPVIRGMENFPAHGPALVVINHLGDADVVLLAASVPALLDGMGKIELSAHWLVGPLFRAYGVIWVHRGKPDRKAVRAALDALSQGRFLTLAPEGRQSLIRGLEEGTEGAAFLALKSGAPVVPVAMTGTENDNVYGHMRRLKRAPVTLTVGKPFYLNETGDHHQSLQEGTEHIMRSLAELLPESYRGAYQ
ncbi:MAG: lysophospholipid acyltransferase family protein [Chloroflexota bacterium]